MKETLVAKNDLVLIKPLDKQEEMYGSIIVPDMGTETPEVGKVLGVGPGRRSEFGAEIEVHSKVGDIVVVPKIGTIRFTYNGTEYFIVRDKEILVQIIEQEEDE